MSKIKRYYWLKLKEDFFRQLEIKRMRKLAGGDTYTIIYLKLLLLSLKYEGRLYYEQVGDDFVDELALELDESIDNIKVTLGYLESKKLLEIITTDEYYLSEMQNMIGSESTSASRVRKHREQNKKQNALQCNTNVTASNKNVTLEKDIEKNIEKEEEGESEGKILLTPPILFGKHQNVRLSKEEYNELYKELGEKLTEKIEYFSDYLKSTGKDYNSHFATIRLWYRQDKEKDKAYIDNTKDTIDYSIEEGESL